MTQRAILILPKETPVLDSNMPLYFLAGPVRGGGDWQREVFEMISKKDPKSYVVCPWRYGDADSIRAHEQKGATLEFESQTAWERHYLDIASKRGAILFWLPCESATSPRKKEDGPYAQETYGELGEWRARKHFEPDVRLVVGAETNFPGLKAIKRNYEVMVGKDFVIHESLEAAVDAAIVIAHT